MGSWGAEVIKKGKTNFTLSEPFKQNAKNFIEVKAPRHHE
jgi:hypothetical protein